jgi:cytochrome c-type biogenesis protein CcmH/NrfG
MGLISGLLTLPVAPLRGTVWVAEQVLRQAEDSYYDPVAIRSQLEEVDRLRAEGAIDEDTATAWEDELVERLIAGQEMTRRD